ncbi:hypothetical protein PGB90_009054 [Kerria lacca]
MTVNTNVVDNPGRAQFHFHVQPKRRDATHSITKKLASKISQKLCLIKLRIKPATLCQPYWSDYVKTENLKFTYGNSGQQDK